MDKVIGHFLHNKNDPVIWIFFETHCCQLLLPNKKYDQSYSFKLNSYGLLEFQQWTV